MIQGFGKSLAVEVRGGINGASEGVDGMVGVLIESIRFQDNIIFTVRVVILNWYNYSHVTIL